MDMNRCVLAITVDVMGVGGSANIASAELIRGISIDFVTIGNPGNPGDVRTGTDEDGNPVAAPYGCGAVDYEYRIGKYEVTNAQWDDFVTAAGAPTGNPSFAYDGFTSWTGDNIPTNNVTWYEATQFCNYLTSGDKSRGAYQFSGDNSNPGDFVRVDRDSALSTYGIVYVIPTEDEWYKAAYYTGSSYSTYANGTDTAPIGDVDTNYVYYAIGVPWDVGSGTEEQNGTFDIMGNAWEWNETPITGSNRGQRGGSYFGGSDGSRSSSPGYDVPPFFTDGLSGFRVASVPEPTTLLLLGVGSLALLRRRR
jgi:formylglycine-generating enzyme required for sulfatase activity